MIDISNNLNNEGLPVFTNDEWEELNKQFSKNEIKRAMVDHIVDNNIPFPFRKIEHRTVIDKFWKLKRSSLSDFLIMNISPDNVMEKFDYKYNWENYGKFIINIGHYYNDISNYYQQEERLKCGSYSFDSPIEIWNDKEKLYKMNWTFWRKGITKGKGVTPPSYRGAFRLGSYVATQFKPHAAFSLYNYFDANHVLDTSMGWGDRLAAFYASGATFYSGCDPNPKTFEIYIKQCIDYENFLSGKNPIIEKNVNRVKIFGKDKTVHLFRGPAENWNELYDGTYNEVFDFAFTSPPYFTTEEYNKGGEFESEQSWSRYPSFIDWRDKFFFKVSDRTLNCLIPGGKMLINIIDPKIKQRYHLCDDLVDRYKNKFRGQIGMRMMQRPKVFLDGEKNNHFKKFYIEPIWIFER